MSVIAKLVKRLVLAWDPDFAKVTKNELKEIKDAEKSGFISEDNVDWNNLKQYLKTDKES